MASCGKNPFAKMNKRIVIEENTRTTDGQGGYTEAWTTLATVWASIEPIKGYEKFQAAQMQTPVTHKIMIRYRTGITTACRINYDNRTFDIKEVLNVDEDKAQLKITAQEI